MDWVPMYLFCPMLSPAYALALCRSQVRGGAPIVSVFLCTIQNNFLLYRALVPINGGVETENEEEEISFFQISREKFEPGLAIEPQTSIF